MKLLITILILACITQFAFAQNLVPNPSFEQYDTCPTSTNQVKYATGWSIDINSSDYFNSCANSGSVVDVPNTSLGYQCPANGNAFCGFHAFKGILPALAQYREYFGRALSSPLNIGEKYYISFKISLADESYCAVNKVGIKFTNINYGDTTLLPVPIPVMNNNASFYTNIIISDTSGWTTISGTFIADSSYQYVIIGNFFDNSHTDTCLFHGNICYNSYYFIDDICVSTDSLTCVIPNEINACNTGINTELLFENIELFPNPAIEKITINQNKIQKAMIRIYNSYGKCLFENKYMATTFEIELTYYPSGIYYVIIFQDDKVTNKKLTIIR